LKAKLKRSRKPGEATRAITGRSGFPLSYEIFEGSTPRAQLKAYERRLLEGEWQSVSGEVEVQLIAQDNRETYVLARSRARAQKERAMRFRVVRGLMRDLIRLRRLLRNGRLKDPDRFFSTWDDSKSVISKPGDT